MHGRGSFALPQASAEALSMRKAEQRKGQKRTKTHLRPTRVVNRGLDGEGAHDPGQLTELQETWKLSAPYREAPAWCDRSIGLAALGPSA